MVVTYIYRGKLAHQFYIWIVRVLSLASSPAVVCDGARFSDEDWPAAVRACGEDSGGHCSHEDTQPVSVAGILYNIYL